MTAQPVHEPAPDDPAEILRRLPRSGLPRLRWPNARTAQVREHRRAVRSKSVVGQAGSPTWDRRRHALGDGRSQFRSASLEGRDVRGRAGDAVAVQLP